MQKFIMVLSGGKECFHIFKDLYSAPDTLVLSQPTLHVNNIFLRFIRKIHLSDKINYFINLPLKFIWKKYISLDKVNFNSEIKYFIIFTDTAINKMEARVLNQYKKQYNIKYILYMLNSMNSDVVSKTIIGKKIKAIKFDYIYTFDREDVKNYGYLFYPTPCSKTMLKEDLTKNSVFNHIYFLGRDKGRLADLIHLYEYLDQLYVNINFIVVDNNKQKMKCNDRIRYETYLEYEENIRHLLNANCILEIIHGTQKGMTLRYCEAVVYGKKLLTNNKDAVNLPFYNPKYMKIFESPQDIDTEWLLEIETCNYGYEGEFSPVYFLHHIQQNDKYLN